MTTAATAIEIDQAGADMLRDKLGEDDWMYASIDDGISYEVVRINSLSGKTVYIDRNVENTGVYAFNLNAKLTYILGTEAVNDVIEDVLYNQLDMTGTGAARVTRTEQFKWNIHVDKVTIHSDYPDITVIDLYPTFFITKK